MTSPTFPKLDPAAAEFWNVRYQASFVPWDAGRVPGCLRRFVATTPAPRNVLVPGCGSAWDVRFMAEQGWNVVGIDFSREAVAAARLVLGPHASRVRQADFFAPIAEAPFGLLYERALLCALPRRLWGDWARRVAQLVAPGGLLAGFFFFDAGERGPPFPLRDAAELQALLAPHFTRLVDLDVDDSIPAFAGRERWQAWQRQ